MRTHESKEFHQVNDEAPQVKESSSLIVAKDGQVSQEVTKTSSSLPIAPKLTRKSTAPRFMTPLQGRIIDQGADVTLEGIIDGKPLFSLQQPRKISVSGPQIKQTYTLIVGRLPDSFSFLDQKRSRSCTHQRETDGKLRA